MDPYQKVKQRGEQIHHKQCCIFRDFFMMKIFVLSDFESDMHVSHKCLFEAFAKENTLVFSYIFV